MKKVCIFLLVFCLGFRSPALLVQASGGETEEGSQAQNYMPPAEVQEQNENSNPAEAHPRRKQKTRNAKQRK